MKILVVDHDNFNLRVTQEIIAACLFRPDSFSIRSSNKGDAWRLIQCWIQ